MIKKENNLHVKGLWRYTKNQMWDDASCTLPVTTICKQMWLCHLLHGNACPCTGSFYPQFLHKPEYNTSGWFKQKVVQ